MSFSFGAKSTAPPAFGTATPAFGQAPTQPTFGAPAGGLQFGATAGQPAAQTTGLFGAPNAVAPSSGFSFGTPATQAPAFGAQTSAPAFGAPSASVAPTFGAPAASVAPTFGTPQATAAPSFGTPASAAPPAFGQQTSAAPTGLFGTPASTAAPAANLFGTTTQSSGFSFGSTGQVPTASVAPTLQTPAPTGGLTFATPASSAAPATNLSFGLPSATSTAPTLSFGGTTAASTAPSLSLNFNTPASTAPSFSLGGLGGTSTTTTATVGLGGIATSQAKTGTKVSTQKEVAPKEQTLPNEILQTVEQFKEFVKQQKMHSSDISRCSVRDYMKVEQEIDLLNNLLVEVETQLQKNRQMTEKLKYDTAKGLQNVEMAQRTQDTPPGLQYENTAPLKFFMELADTFERDMMSLKNQIESADRYLRHCNNPDQITQQDIALGMKRLHETFVALAGQLQAVHTQVESQKESYINLRKHIFGDHSNPFSKITTPSSGSEKLRTLLHSPPKIATGPTPFNNLTLGGNVMNSLPNPQQMPSFPGTLATGSSFQTNQFAPAPYGGTQPSNTSLFGSGLTQPGFNFNTSGNTSTFQLQKPPTGNKRAH